MSVVCAFSHFTFHSILLIVFGTIPNFHAENEFSIPEPINFGVFTACVRAAMVMILEDGRYHHHYNYEACSQFQGRLRRLLLLPRCDCILWCVLLIAIKMHNLTAHSYVFHGQSAEIYRLFRPNRTIYLAYLISITQLCIHRFINYSWLFQEPLQFFPLTIGTRFSKFRFGEAKKKLFTNFIGSDIFFTRKSNNGIKSR